MYPCFLAHAGKQKVARATVHRPQKVWDRILDRVFKINVNEVPRNVSVENIKPAYFVSENVFGNPSSSSHVSSRETTPALKTYSRKSVRFAPGTKE